MLAVGATAITFALSAWGSMAAEERKPNVLIVVADDMLWRDCEPYGNPEVKTPNMAQQGDKGMETEQQAGWRKGGGGGGEKKKGKAK